MKALTSLIALTVATSALVAANISATKVENSLEKVSYNSNIWNNANFSDVTVYPQTAIKFNDKKANELNANNGAKRVQVAAVYNDSRIALMVKWADDTMNIQQGNKTDAFPDGFAMQFASDYSNPQALPYIGMGSIGRPVVIHLQKAVRPFYEPNGRGNVYYQMNREQTEVFGDELKAFDAKVKKLGSNDYEKSYVAQGFRSMTEIKDASDHSYARLGYRNGQWEGTLSRPLKDDYVNLDNGVIPMAVAIWAGEKRGRDGLKFLSQWLSVELQGKKGGEALVAALDDQGNGDVAAGRTAVEQNGCTGCHQVAATDPSNLMGPSLANIGGYATTGYLIESLKNPSAVIVPGYNRNAHSNYPWYTLDNGKRVSAMTDYSWLDETTMNNIIAYLKSLKAEVK